ncbi:hypothetical protein LTR33_008662 [Friedmanniomyces endolithicus]|nr:hypothetical protein LTR33_008662 [Friedmanniomyces endolithicus]
MGQLHRGKKHAQPARQPESQLNISSLTTRLDRLPYSALGGAAATGSVTGRFRNFATTDAALVLTHQLPLLMARSTTVEKAWFGVGRLHGAPESASDFSRRAQGSRALPGALSISSTKICKSHDHRYFIYRRYALRLPCGPMHVGKA